MARHAEDFLLKKTAKSPFWYYRLKGWKEFKTTGLKTKAAAKSYALEQWQLLGGNGKRTKFSVYTTDFFSLSSPWSQRQLDRERMLESTIKWRKQLFNTHIKTYFGTFYFDEITTNIIDNYLTSLDKSGQTKDHIRTTLNLIFKEALRDNIISDNPVIHIEKAKDDHVPNQPPSMDELLSLFPDDIDKMKETWSSLIYGLMCEVTASTGLRMQEVRALTPRAIVPEKQGVKVVQAVKTTGEIGLPKANEIRIVLAPRRTIDRLLWWIESKGIEDDNLIFSRTEGKPISMKVPYKFFLKALAKLEIDRTGRKLTVHGLRHAYNTRMREILTDAALDGFWDDEQMCFANKLKSADQILREMTGHKSEAMTNLYDHPDLVKKLDAFQIFTQYSDKFWKDNKNKERK